MDYTYFITNKDNQLLQLINTIDYVTDEVTQEEQDCIVKLKEELIALDGIHVTPEQYNCIISVLLKFVPSYIKNVS
ncbi:hypothetical protein A374_09963 [Fictibacillus macauensis ZFHKF-1]|uniref:Uncharacterized protein n=1 Tax=Fictibacillus macauensis ZFHKF-1 TaxID=1196324 RepID=I8AJ84_9BACL|nr:hypothetical protein [Fictibacillus macauensis]EIT85554.1 hypothetical protein A374_09963 [Fictibacillus macauensis ZFHKF-1]